MQLPHYTIDYRDEDCAAIAEIADHCGMSRLYLCVAINAESSFRSGAASARSSAVGLIQWMPDPFSKKYPGNRTRESFIALGVRGQLPLIRERYAKHKGHLSRLGDVYGVITAPAAVGINLDEPIYAKQGATRFGRDTSVSYIKNYPHWDLLDTGAHTLRGMALWARVSAEGPRFREMVLRVTGAESPWRDLSTDEGLSCAITELGYGSLRELQAALGLVVDGVCGPRTKARILTALPDFDVPLTKGT